MTVRRLRWVDNRASRLGPAATFLGVPAWITGRYWCGGQFARESGPEHPSIVVIDIAGFGRWHNRPAPCQGHAERDGACGLPRCRRRMVATGGRGPGRRHDRARAAHCVQSRPARPDDSRPGRGLARLQHGNRTRMPHAASGVGTRRGDPPRRAGLGWRSTGCSANGHRDDSRDSAAGRQGPPVLKVGMERSGPDRTPSRLGP
jgi:hypothetical protein